MARKNNYSWNETLKFSWGHITAFLALIFLSYIMYMGEFYLNGGDFVKAAIYVALIDVALLVTFIGAQYMKASDHHFNRSIIIERILIVLCPVAFLWAMIPYNHFWNVLSEREQIERKFSSSIVGAKQMFVEFEEYSGKRLNDYDETLDRIIAETQNTGAVNTRSKGDYMRALRLQLLSQNTDSLRVLAVKWINDADKGTSVWNAFLIGNIGQISNSISVWDEKLTACSDTILSNENRYHEVKSFKVSGNACENALNGLSELSNIYKRNRGVNATTIWTGIILFLMLILPYIIQRRNTKATGIYHLVPFIGPKDKKMKEPKPTRKKKERRKETDASISGGTLIFEETDDDVFAEEKRIEPETDEPGDEDDLYSGTF